MGSREFIEFRRSLRRSAGLFMLRLNISNSAASTTRSAATGYLFSVFSRRQRRPNRSKSQIRLERGRTLRPVAQAGCLREMASSRCPGAELMWT